MIVQKKGDGGAMGGKTARACDNCVRKRARWYCAADDAFLCQSCDGAVHSANPLARRHERVRLKTASLKNLKEMGFSSEPTWHRGFTKKARTPRSAKAPPPALSRRNPVRLVPECGGDETSVEETEEQLLYRVPAYDPFEAELCSNRTGSQPPELDHLHGFLPSEMDLAEFAADVESLLGKGLENESFGMEGLGLRECDVREREMMSSLVVKLEDDDTEGLLMTVEDVGEEGSCHVDATELDTFELNFDDYNSAMSCGEEDDEKLAVECKGAAAEDVKFEAKKKRSYKEAFLKLDHDAVIVAWSGRGGLPWTGERPDLSLVDDCWPHCLGICGEEVENPYRAGVMGGGGYGGQLVGILGDTAAGREAKVSRYREKRRTRLFSKKIRYEVRKLNAEKRPRMKGRFVKRASFGAPPTSFPLPPVLTK